MVEKSVFALLREGEIAKSNDNLSPIFTNMIMRQELYRSNLGRGWETQGRQTYKSRTQRFSKEPIFVMVRPKSADTVCSLCGETARGYTRVSQHSTSTTSREAYVSICVLFEDTFPFDELVLCRSCWRNVTGLARELNKVCFEFSEPVTVLR